MLKQNTALQLHLLNRLRENVCGEKLLPMQQRRLFNGAIATLCDLELDADGCNRRTIGLLPLPAMRQDHEIVDTDNLKLKQLLLSIEARGISCCIRVFSNTRKSRSALLIFRGRLIGSVYGCRDLSAQVYGKQAFDNIMSDILAPHNVIDAYPLTDELVLAAASLFHGGLNDVFDGSSALHIYPNCARMMLNNRRTGCIVASRDDDSAVCVTYIYEGKIVGVYSFADGWLTKTQAAALDCIENRSGVTLSLSVLPVECEFAGALTESLTGLDMEPTKVQAANNA